MSAGAGLRPLRALVVGAGPASEAFHMPVLAQLKSTGGLDLVQICDLRRDRAADLRRRFGFAEDSGEALPGLRRADIDVVYLFASAQVHYEYGLEALRHGKHLFVEKPVAPDSARARELACTRAVRPRRSCS